MPRARLSRLFAVHGWLLSTGLSALQACRSGSVAPMALAVGGDTHVQAAFDNGDFESGASSTPNAPSGWSMSPNLNIGPVNVTVSSPPSSPAVHNLQAGGYQAGAAIGPLSGAQAISDSAGHVQITASANAAPGDDAIVAHPHGPSSPSAAIAQSNSLTTPLTRTADPNSEQYTQVTRSRCP